MLPFQFFELCRPDITTLAVDAIVNAETRHCWVAGVWMAQFIVQQGQRC